MNYFKVFILFFWSLFYLTTYGQEKTPEKLEEVIITSSRIEVPFSKNTKNIKIISADDIKQSAASNLTDLLQMTEGIDIIQRGVNGMQADIKIRGGNFQQVLILIDGFKTEDPQTGHHTMNMLIPLENIERIEIVKGASARVFGQNAFTGAINIVTKKIKKDKLTVGMNYGSFDYVKGAVTVSKTFQKSKHQIHYSHQQSDGYRFNTDFKNNNYFIKSNFDIKNNQSINVIATFSDRKFGAHYFYTPPTYNFKEYEETQTSLVGVSTKYTLQSIVLKPKLYWKRNQDMFLLKRNEPSFYRNHTISNKVGAEINTAYTSKIGVTGFGVDFSKVYLASSNLNNQQRDQVSIFAEHRYVTKNEKIDVTPGVSINYFSDFGFHAFPGLDIGYKANETTHLFFNIGSSYRVPSYIEMYYNDPSTIGNKNLKPEKALTQEIGMTFTKGHVAFNSSVFYRISKDLIDFIKKTEASPKYEANNIRQINTLGVEFNGLLHINVASFNQYLKFGYTFLEDDYDNVPVFASKYVLNTSMKHHFTASLHTQFIKNIEESISYKYIEKPLNKYQLLDVKVSYKLKKIKAFILANNILDTNYFEQVYIPMPKSNVQIGVSVMF